MTTGTLIIGASQAGLQVATSLRDLGYDEPITLVGAEQHLPYQRPPLSKAFLLGKATSTSLAFRKEEFFAEHKIDLRTGTKIVRLDAAKCLATSEGGEQFSFDKPALTVGAAPRRIEVPGAGLEGVRYLRDVDDALALRDSFAWAQDVVVIGGGFIGLEAAAVSLQHGKTVTVVEALPRLLSRVGTPLLGDFYRDAHQRRGVRFCFGEGVERIVGDDRVRAIILTDGTEIPADLVLVGIGVVPSTDLARQIDAECNGAIVVDEMARTSVTNVVAAGDCTVGPDPQHGDNHVRLESVQNAVDQAKVAAATLAGRPTPYRNVPWFWSDQGDLKLHMAGLSTGYESFVVRRSIEDEKFSILYYRGDEFIAIACVNRAPDYVVARNALTQGFVIPADGAVDASVSLKEVIAKANA